MTNRVPNSALKAGATRLGKAAPTLLAAAAIALTAGCTAARRDSIIVGSIPDDYRTAHPIVISEQEQTLDIPVGAGDHTISHAQRTALDGFLARYDRSASPTVRVMLPVGSRNEAAASRVGRDVLRAMAANGIRSSLVSTFSYQVTVPDASAPIRVSYTALKAQTDKCGRWPADILAGSDQNKNYANFGCSYQNNLAAQIANPADLIGPRRPGEVDATRRGVTIGDYRATQTTWGNSPTIQY